MVEHLHASASQSRGGTGRAVDAAGSKRALTVASPTDDTGAVEPTASPVSVVTLNGAPLAFQSFGTSGPVIILVAGASSSMDWWDDAFCLLLAAGDPASGPRRVIRYDLRDTGQSETVPRGQARYTGSDLVDDLGALVEHLDAGPVHLVGLSMGGGLAQQLALRRPGLLATITLMSTTPGSTAGELPPPTPELSASFGIEVPETDWADAEAVGQAFIDVERQFSGTIRVDEERIRRIAAQVRRRTDSPRSSENHWAIADGDGMRADITAIRLPTLVVHGSHDPLFPLPHGERLAQLIPGARLVVVPSMGHQNPPPPTWPQIVAALLEHTA